MGAVQKVKVKGTVICQKRRYADAQIVLVEKDRLDSNDVLDKCYSNREGDFEIAGEEDEIGAIDPFITIRHNCNAQPGCERIGKYPIPAESINGREYDMSYISLDIMTLEEKLECA
ncbi:unnamed protein product [Caenorhabditis bovis]|uniref:Uncharacterized protein n=1 Tax=Caenorhabditis bovis TaxID=2654633 RepID=A0A8S1F1E0_9PELO|nr:unnamed protein product [Caenorhabditis bovis]